MEYLNSGFNVLLQSLIHDLKTKVELALNLKSTIFAGNNELNEVWKLS